MALAAACAPADDSAGTALPASLAVTTAAPTPGGTHASLVMPPGSDPLGRVPQAAPSTRPDSPPASLDPSATSTPEFTETTATTTSATTPVSPPPPTRPGPHPGLIIPTGARPRLDGRHVALVSDSMLLGGAGDIVAGRLTEAGARVTDRDARGGFALFQHPGLLEALASPDPEVIVGVFGYNDVANMWVSPSERGTVYRAFDRAVATAEATGTCWVWPTIGTDFLTYTTLSSTWPYPLAEAQRLALELDDHMIATAARSRFVRVVDWQPLIDRHRSTWTGDGLHLTTAGARQFAEVLVEAVAACPPLSEDQAIERAAQARTSVPGISPATTARTGA